MLLIQNYFTHVFGHNLPEHISVIIILDDLVFETLELEFCLILLSLEAFLEVVGGVEAPRLPHVGNLKRNVEVHV